MTAFELQFYEAGIKDANESRAITLACRSMRYEHLSKAHGLKIGKDSAMAVKAYNAGVAYEINRQTILGF